MNGFYADAVVFHDEAVIAHFNADITAFAAIANGVADEIIEDFPDIPLYAAHREFPFHGKGNVFVAALAGERVRHLLRHGAHIHIGERLVLAELRLAQQQDVVDHRAHAAGFL